MMDAFCWVLRRKILLTIHESLASYDRKNYNIHLKKEKKHIVILS